MKLKNFFRQIIALSFGVVVATFAYADGDNEPVPSFYQETGFSANRDYVNQHANEHVDPFTGKLQWHFVDLYIPGNGRMDIKVQRSYSSVNEQVGEASPFGVGWTMHFGRVLRSASANFCAHALAPTLAPVVELPDGSRQLFYDSIDPVDFTSTGLWKAKCNAASGLDIYSPDGFRYEMATVGPLVGIYPAQSASFYATRITDRNGNVLNFTYDYVTSSIFAIKTISSSDGRNVAFTYTNGALSSITDGTRIWQYRLTPVPGYLTQFYLNEVQRPDGAIWKFEYNPPAAGPQSTTAGANSISNVTYPTGGTISYTYGFVRFDLISDVTQRLPKSTVVNTKTADNTNWNYEFTPATEKAPAGPILVDRDSVVPGFDRTKVSGPEGVTVYFHLGYNSVASNNVWQIGLLAGKIIATNYAGTLSDTQAETNSWNPATISNQRNLRPGQIIFDDKIFAPLLLAHSVSRNGQAFNTTFSNFDAYLNPQTITETGTDTRITTLTYFTDASKWIIRVKQNESVSTILGAITRTFDANANLLVESRYGVPTTYTYTPEGDVSSKKDARDNVVAYGDYRRGIPRNENHPELVTISRAVSDDGNVLAETDGEGATTTYAYDSLNRIKTIAHPMGNSVAVTWTTTPALSQRTVERGAYSEVVTYDSFGREVTVTHTDKSGSNTTSIIQTHKYDAIGRKVFSSYPNSSLGTGYLYDLVGQIQYVLHENSPGSTSNTSGRSFAYKANKVELTNERGLVFTNTFRVYGSPDSGQLLQIDAPETSANVAMTRNGLGQLLTATQNNLTRSYEYDTRYYLKTISEPETGSTSYLRDALGNMTARQIGSSPTTTFGYDGLNRLTTINYPVGGLVAAPNVTKTYYKDGRLKSSGNNVARHEHLYDLNKNQIRDTLTTGGQTFITQYSYNGNDALDVLAYSSGKTVTYAPDAFGRPTQAKPFVLVAKHHPNGQLASFTYANGITTIVNLNARQWPTTISAPAITDMIYSYDGLGNVYKIEDTVVPARNRAMAYDGIDRLTTANGASWGNGTISYDGRGNIKTHNLGAASNNLTYDYDGVTNRLNSVTGRKNLSYSYDVYGNVSGNGANTFFYDHALNMRCANCGLANEVSYDYDADSTRVKSTKGGVATYYVYGLGGKLLGERVPGVSLKEYIYLDGKQVAERNNTGN